MLVDFRDRPAPVPRETFYGFRNRDFEKMRSDLVTVKVRTRLQRQSILCVTSSGMGARRAIRIATPPRFASNDSTAINRELRSWLTEDTVWDNQSDLRASFSTGKVEHDLVAGVALTRENNIRRTRTAPNSPTTLLNPNPDDVFTGVITTSPIVGDISANSQALFVFDTAKLGKKWELNGGLRWDRFDAAGITTTGAPVARGRQDAECSRRRSFQAEAAGKPLRLLRHVAQSVAGRFVLRHRQHSHRSGEDLHVRRSAASGISLGGDCC